VANFDLLTECLQKTYKALRFFSTQIKVELCDVLFTNVKQVFIVVSKIIANKSIEFVN
jgi:hypothetical protein